MDALLEAVRVCMAQSTAVQSPVRWTRGTQPPSLLCAACGRPAQHRCGRCLQSVYCSKPCQVAHWAHHKGPCKVDKKRTGEAEALYFIDPKCRHGGPDIERDPALNDNLHAAMRCMGALPPNEELELLVLCNFVRTSPPHAGLSRILLSCAVDAFADENLSSARVLARMGTFFAAVRKQPALLGEIEAALEAGSGSGGGAVEGSAPLRALAADVMTLASRSGLLAALRLPITCACLTPCGPGALPLSEVATGPAEGGGGSGGGGSELSPAAIAAMSAKELKAALAARGVSTVGLLEKGELQAALLAALTMEEMEKGASVWALD